MRAPRAYHSWRVCDITKFLSTHLWPTRPLVRDRVEKAEGTKPWTLASPSPPRKRVRRVAAPFILQVVGAKPGRSTAGGGEALRVARSRRASPRRLGRSAAKHRFCPSTASSSSTPQIGAHVTDSSEVSPPPLQPAFGDHRTTGPTPFRTAARISSTGTSWRRQAPRS